MKASFQLAILLLCVCALTSRAEPTPRPSGAKHKVPAPRQKSSERAGATGLFVLHLRADGSVDKVLIARSTGNRNLDAWTSRGLSAMRFRPEELTKAEIAKRQKVLPIAISEEELKNARYLPTPRW